MIKALLVDDEQPAVESLQLMLEEYCPQVKIVGTAHSILDGIKEVIDKKPNLLFLDVEMPFGTGFDLLERIPRENIQVIFVTAYNHYAIKAIKFNALYYLMKPIDIDELIEAVDKVQSNLQQNTSPDLEKILDNLQTQGEVTPAKIKIPTQDGMQYVRPDEVFRFEAAGSYTSVFLTNGNKIIVSKNLKFFEPMLSEKEFYRVHTSHIVNMIYIKKYIRTGGDRIEMEGGAVVPVSRRRKDGFLKTLNNL